MDKALVPANETPVPISGAAMEQVLIGGDLRQLEPADRVRYYMAVCQSVGLNHLTKPFEYIILNGKMTLYAKRDATDQLRSINGISITIKSREVVGEVYVVTACAMTSTGRRDESIGAVTIGTLKGEALANAMMKAETKAKRRVTLSICGMGWLDETEVETVPSAKYLEVDHASGEIREEIDTGGAQPGTREAAQNVAAAKLAAAGVPVPARVISEAQRKRMLVEARTGGYETPDGKVDVEAIKRVLKRYGYDSSKDVTEDKYDSIIRGLRGEEPLPPPSEAYQATDEDLPPELGGKAA